MRILIIGGTLFVGRHLVEAARERGHEVTLFNRGKTNPGLFPEVGAIVGDRRTDAGLDSLKGRTWDAVIDTSAYFPRDVQGLLDRLAERIEHYTFISSISVYAPADAGPDEESPVIELTSEMPRDRVTGENYGALKGAAEEVARGMMPERTLVVRPGLIVGPHDPTDRFTWWTTHVGKGGDVLAPGDLSEPVQFIDVRDLAGWTLEMIEKGATGTYNATGPAQPLSMREFIDVAVDTLAEKSVDLRKVSEEELLAAEVAPYTELPLWIPAASNGMSRTSIERALSEGLHLRPLEETLSDTLEWFRTTERYSAGELRAGGAERKLGFE